MKRPQLVSSFLESMSRKALVQYQATIRRYVRGRSGIYALYLDKQIYYVGLAQNLMGRLSHHLADRHKEQWNRFSVYLTIGDHMRELESLFLRIWKPTGNRQKGKFPGAEDLQRRLKRDVEAFHKQERRDLFGENSPHQPKLSGTAGRDGRGLTGERRPLRAKFKRKTVRALLKPNGRILFRKKSYDSPSDAAKAAVGGRAENGWQFWRFERAPGDWVRLDALRRK